MGAANGKPSRDSRSLASGITPALKGVHTSPEPVPVASSTSHETQGICDSAPEVSQPIEASSVIDSPGPAPESREAVMSENIQRALIERWAEGIEFRFDASKTMKHEFSRLAKMKGWVGGGEDWNAHWLACFGSAYEYTGLNHTQLLQLYNKLKPRNPRLFEKLNVLPKDGNYKQEFFRIAHDAGLFVGSPNWCRHWKTYMNEQWTVSTLGGYGRDGAATDLQRLCFGVYPDFALDDDSPLAKQFNRLAQSKNWDTKQTEREQRWCFGYSWAITSNNEPRTNTTALKSSSTSISGSYSIIITPPSTRCGSSASDIGYESDDSLASVTGSAYWRQFIGFEPNPSANVAEEFDRLSLHEGWSTGSSEWRSQKGDAYEVEFEHWYGTEKDKLETWQSLCKEVGIDPVPETITQCRKVLKGVLVNLVNLIDHRRNGTPLLRFATYKAFRKYTAAGHIFPRNQAKRDGFIKALLQHLG